MLAEVNYFSSYENMPDFNETEIVPPWVKYPGYPPGDMFWRQTGEEWFCSVWKPFWYSLTITGQNKYLVRWEVPRDWQDFYFDPAFRKAVEDEDSDILKSLLLP